MNKVIKIIVISVIYLMILAILVVKAYNLKSEELNKLRIDLEDKEEQIYILENENKRLENIINNYTIEERKNITF